MSIEFSVFKKDGADSGEKLVIETPAFEIEPHDHAIYLAVKAEMTNVRQGTHSTKTRGEVRGGGKKPWKQKGTGRARSGSRRNPVWVGGGRIFGPKPHSYQMKVNKKVKLLARQSALAYRYKEGVLKVIEDLVLAEPKARVIRDLLNKFELTDKKVTILTANLDDNLYLACRNFGNILVLEAETVSTYDLLDCEALLIDKSGLEKLNSALLGNQRN
ncbi:MAG: 50S ribosomal protein L4 [Candidatus Marinimicrobia bacterium]|nr:50S ribosomal protein L4 [Candidatus Neomarinimicrobiota bacterium]MCK9482918.1 50S ribosomal protein L4 [Candidatus Neomarinimicrobiota bacterium]MCK9559470.1 50S ribosomal protein L4 [Candidatus Neomarinimicrobiota bacterium]